ncbi:polysaccharide biosynthesis protein [Bacillus cereus]|uniref:lipopolysaccharide biosynthesis protein n=1 Tax=Bacillus cereus TaxID=1396 RepID=UPI000BF370B5|nr:oligosaccharide flippase family protein [Bacillus cereus]MDA2530936.1 oligosaccharide flippase family protein [Bacillus cereus]PET16275.1 polysaccharide biosynthesis protein [Bacillus cereus]PEV27371.1 polysaccharide biosynthesis protein [Bacillus cereus]PFQ57206.1 polysaccharide biosynthesis protein [Bacillus cereus]
MMNVEKVESNQGAISLKKNFSWTFIGNIIYAACQWAILMLFTKLGSVKMVGVFSLGLAITAPVYMFLNLQLQGILATDKKNNYSFNEYFSLRLMTSNIGMLLIMVFLLISNYDLVTKWVVFLIALAKYFDSFSEIIFGLLQNKELMKRISISLILKGLLSVSSMFLSLYITGDILISMICYAVSSCVIFILYDMKSMKMFKQCIKVSFVFSKLKSLFLLSLPMGLVMLLISLNTNIPRYFIENYLGAESLGYFSALAYVMVAGNTVISALGQACVSRLAQYYVEMDIKSFRVLLFKLIGIGILIGIIGVVVIGFIGEEILTIIYSDAYKEYNHIFILIMISAGIGYISSFMGYGMTAARCYKVQPVIFGIVSIVTILLSYWCVPQYGLTGAGITLIFASIVQLIGSSLVIVYLLKKR